MIKKYALIWPYIPYIGNWWGLKNTTHTHTHTEATWSSVQNCPAKRGSILRENEVWKTISL